MEITYLAKFSNKQIDMIPQTIWKLFRNNKANIYLSYLTILQLKAVGKKFDEAYFLISISNWKCLKKQRTSKHHSFILMDACVGVHHSYTVNHHIFHLTSSSPHIYR